MSIEYTRDYSNHTLLDNKNKYTELYKLSSAEASDVHKGDLLLLKTQCGRYGIFMASDEPDPDNTLHLTKYYEIDFIKSCEWLI
jgi:hypothetical protein